MSASTLQSAIGLLGLVAVFLAGTAIVRRCTLPATLESVREGRWHFLLAGGLLALVLPQAADLSLREGLLLRGLIGIGLVWIGFHTGLELDYRVLQSHDPRRLAGESLRLLLAFGIAFAVARLVLPAVGPPLGIEAAPAPTALLMASLAVCARSAGFFALATRRPARVVPGPAALLAGPLAIVLLAFLLPLYSSDSLHRLGPLIILGYGRVAGLAVAMGLLLGVLVDFAFRAQRDIARGLFVAFGAMVAVSGICLEFRLPGLAVGLLAGLWVINTTVRKREILELAETAGAAAEPVFLVLAGAALVSLHADSGANPRTVLVVAAGILLLRAAARGLAAFAAHTVQDRLFRGVDLLVFAWNPMGLVAVALAVQSLLVEPRFASPSVPVGLLIAVLFTQTIVLPHRRVVRNAEGGA